MSTLQERLDRIREGFHKQAPESVISVFSRVTEDLRASGITSGVPEVGDALPPFELPDTDGTTVRSAELLARGPVVLTVYRGLW